MRWQLSDRELAANAERAERAIARQARELGDPLTEADWPASPSSGKAR